MEKHFEDSTLLGNNVVKSFTIGIQITSIKLFKNEPDSFSLKINESSQISASDLYEIIEKHESVFIKLYEAYKEGILDGRIMDHLLDIQNWIHFNADLKKHFDTQTFLRYVFIRLI